MVGFEPGPPVARHLVRQVGRVHPLGGVQHEVGLEGVVGLLDSLVGRGTCRRGGGGNGEGLGRVNRDQRLRQTFLQLPLQGCQHDLPNAVEVLGAQGRLDVVAPIQPPADLPGMTLLAVLVQLFDAVLKHLERLQPVTQVAVPVELPGGH